MEYSKTRGILLLVTLTLRLCTLARCSIECESMDDRQNGTCVVSDGCAAANRDYDTQTYIGECFPNNPTFEDTPDLGDCIVKQGFFFTKSFISCGSDNSTRATQIHYDQLPTNVAVSLASIGVRNFNMSISWEYSGSELVSGYEIRISKRLNGVEDDKVACFCVKNVSQRSFEIPTIPSLSYQRDESYELDVIVSTFPRLTLEPDFDVYSAHQLPRPKWPKHCSSVRHTDQDCSALQYESPTNVIAESTLVSDDSKRLDVSWDPPRNGSDLYRTPEIYYITLWEVSSPEPYELLLHDQQHSYYFMTNNTRNVSLHGLNSSGTYRVRVEAYVPCSGIRYLTRTMTESKQCGMPSSFVDATPKHPTTLYPSTSTPPPSTVGSTTDQKSVPTASTPLPTTLGSTNDQKSVHKAAIAAPVAVAVLIILLVAVAVTVIIVRKLQKRCPKKKPQSLSYRRPPSYPDPTPSVTTRSPPPPYTSCTVVVIFPLDTPEEEREFIHREIGKLNGFEPTFGCKIQLDFFDDHKFQTGTLARVWDEELRIATNILLICTPKFMKEWQDLNCVDGDQNLRLYRFLQAKLTGDVGKTEESKYATVVFRKHHVVPDVCFLGSFKKFTIAEPSQTLEEQMKELENLALFLTKIPRFVHTNGIPHHTIVSSPEPLSPGKNYDYSEKKHVDNDPLPENTCEDETDNRDCIHNLKKQLDLPLNSAAADTDSLEEGSIPSPAGSSLLDVTPSDGTHELHSLSTSTSSVSQHETYSLA